MNAYLFLLTFEEHQYWYDTGVFPCLRDRLILVPVVDEGPPIIDDSSWAFIQKWLPVEYAYHDQNILLAVVDLSIQCNKQYEGEISLSKIYLKYESLIAL